jgi:polyphosphate:AMP phosphotransferase
MFEKVDLNKTIDKEEFKTLFDELNTKLGLIQRQARELKIPIIIVFEGWDAAGKGTIINELILPLDPRGFNVFSTQKPTEEEKLHPFLWRFWNKTPEKGRIAIFDRSWYRKVYIDAFDEKIKNKDISHKLTQIKAFEKQLTNDDNIIIKLFLHISKKEQKKRLEKLEKDPTTKWRVTPNDWKHNKDYEKILALTEKMIEDTDTDYAPWQIIEAHDKKFAIIKILNLIILKIQEKIDLKLNKNKQTNPNKISSIILNPLDASILDKTDLSKSITEEEYKIKLKEYQLKAREIEYKIYTKRIPVIIMYEGWDAAGKGGNIKRFVEHLDPRGYEVIPIASPNDIEKTHHYLWRFWNKIPKAGHIAIFDRTWYGRVLVERVEGFCSETEWKRAYKEINETEEQLVDNNAIILKFWLHIDKEEQLRRFKERQSNQFKQWKITDEDWRNREKWDIYKCAVDEMLFRTSTTFAPWTIIESNNKYYARIKTLKTFIDTVNNAINL